MRWYCANEFHSTCLPTITSPFAITYFFHLYPLQLFKFEINGYDFEQVWISDRLYHKFDTFEKLSASYQPICPGLGAYQAKSLLNPMFSNMASDWLVAVLPANQMPGLKICRRIGVWDLGFESCIQQRKTTCLLSIRISLACARASKLTTTNMYIAKARCESQLAVRSSGLNACWS